MEARSQNLANFPKSVSTSPPTDNIYRSSEAQKREPEVENIAKKENYPNQNGIPTPKLFLPQNFSSPAVFLEKVATMVLSMVLSVVIVFSGYQVMSGNVSLAPLLSLVPTRAAIENIKSFSQADLSAAPNNSAAQTDRSLFPPSAQVALASVSQSVSSLFSDAVRRFTDILLSGFGNIFAPSPEESDPSLARQLAKLKEEVARLKSKSFTIVESTNQTGPPQRTLPQAAVNQPVTERVIERTVSVSGISQADLNKLENSLKSEIYRVASTASSQNNATYQTVALSNRINQLANLAISGAAITGSTYAGSIAGTSGSFETLSVAGTLSAAAVTFTGPLTVSATSTFSAPGIFSFAPAQAHTFGAWAVGVAGANPTGAALLVNPSTAAADSNLLSLSVAGSAKFLIDAEGDVFANSLTASGGVTLSTTTASTFSVENNTTLGDATTTDKTYFNSRIGSSLIPTVNNLLDIGDTANGLAWRTGIFGTSVGIGTTTSPYSRLSVWGGGTGTGQLFELISSASTTVARFLDNGTGYFLGNIGIGTTSPYRKLSVTDTVSAAQAVIAYDSSRFTELQTNSVGDFIITTQGNDAFLNNDNLWVCTGGACPAGTPTGFGNLIVENSLGVGSSTPFAKLSIGADGAIVTTEKALTDGATINVSWTDGNQQRVTLGGNRTINFSNYIAGQILRLVVCQDGTGSRTVTWGGVLWNGGSAPTLTTDANKCDALSFVATIATSTLKIFGASVLSF